MGWLKMNVKAIFAVIIFIFAIIASQPVGINFIIVVEEIPDSDNGDVINAQCWNFGNGQFKIIVSPDAANSSQINRIVAHEIGHVVNWEGDEAYADDFANRIVDDGSEPIVDKYHGVH